MNYAHPFVHGFHCLLGFVRPDEDAVSLLSQVERSLQVPQDGQLGREGLDLRHGLGHHVLVLNRDQRQELAVLGSNFLGPETWKNAIVWMAVWMFLYSRVSKLFLTR